MIEPVVCPLVISPVKYSILLMWGKNQFYFFI